MHELVEAKRQHPAAAQEFQHGGEAGSATREDRLGDGAHGGDVMGVEGRIVHRPIERADRPAARRQCRAHGVVIAEMRAGEDDGPVAGGGFLQRGKAGAGQPVGVADAGGEFLARIDLGHGAPGIVQHLAGDAGALRRRQFGHGERQILARPARPAGDGSEKSREEPAHNRNAAAIGQKPGHRHDAQKGGIGQLVGPDHLVFCLGLSHAGRAPSGPLGSRDTRYKGLPPR